MSSATIASTAATDWRFTLSAASSDLRNPVTMISAVSPSAATVSGAVCAAVVAAGSVSVPCGTTAVCAGEGSTCAGVPGVTLFGTCAAWADAIDGNTSARTRLPADTPPSQRIRRIATVA